MTVPWYSLILKFFCQSKIDIKYINKSSIQTAPKIKTNDSITNEPIRFIQFCMRFKNMYSLLKIKHSMHKSTGKFPNHIFLMEDF
jgi:hypothetical protein